MAIQKFVPLGDQVAAELQRAIVTGEIPAGSILTEEALAARFDVSRGPVRLAFRLLESQHLVEKAGRSYRVVGLEQADLDEIYKLRLAIETLGWQYLQESGNRAPELDQALRRMADAVDRKDVEDFAQADIDFHSIAVKLSGKRRIVTMWDQIEPSMRLVLQVTNRIDDDLDEVYHRHQVLLDALRSGSRALLVGVLEEHIQASRHLLDDTEGSHAQAPNSTG